MEFLIFVGLFLVFMKIGSVTKLLKVIALAQIASLPEEKQKEILEVLK